MQKVKLDAHRGYSAVYPENTLLAFREAMKFDIDMLEIDLHMTKDGEIIMMHDHTVDRTTNGTGYIKDKTLAEMRALDAGSWKNAAFVGEKVPLFVEFLELLKDDPHLEVCVELKDYPSTRDGNDAFVSCDKSIALIEEYGIADHVYINSWSGEILAYVAKKYGGKYRLHGYYPIGLNLDDFDRETYYDKLFCACLFEYRMIDGKRTNMQIPMAQEHFDRVKKYGVEPWVYFKDDTLEKLKTAYERGAVGFTSNDPLLAGKLLDEIGARKLKKS